MIKTISMLNRSDDCIILRHGNIVRDLFLDEHLEENMLIRNCKRDYPIELERIRPIHLMKIDQMLLRKFSDYSFMWVYKLSSERNNGLEFSLDEWLLECEEVGKPVWYHSREKDARKFFVKVRSDATRKLGKVSKCLAFKPQNCCYVDFVYPYIFSKMRIFRRKI